MIDFLAVDSVAFRIGNTEIYWYGIIMCLAIIVALAVAVLYCKIKHYDTEMPINMAFVVVPSGILSARLFSVIFEEGLTLKDYFNFRTGGMSIIGALIGGAIGLVVYVFIKKPEDKWLYFDTAAVVLLLAQAIGRWGNFFNGEVYGQLIDSSSFFARFPFAVEIDGQYYQALFMYESVLNLIGFFAISMVYICSKKHGLPTAIYLIYYGTVRTLLEGLRQEDYILRLWGMPISRVCSAIMIAAGIAILIVLIVKWNKSKVKNEKK